MSKAEKFIQDCTRNCSNLAHFEDAKGNVWEENTPWLTPDQALRAVEIAREEVMQQLMDGAVECDVIPDGIDLLTTESFSEMSTILRKIGAKEGDRVKLIIIKED